MVGGVGLSNTTLKLFGTKETKLRDACREFEANFLYIILKEMDDTKDPLFGESLATDVYRDLRNLEVARCMSEKGVGLADLVAKSLDKFSVKDSIGRSDN